MFQRNRHDRVPDQKSVFIMLNRVYQSLVSIRIAASIASWISLGKFGKFLIDHWTEYTHRFWETIVEFLNLPELKEVDKDALTTLVIVAPLGIICLKSRHSSQPQEVSKMQRYVAYIVAFLLFCFFDERLNIFEAIRQEMEKAQDPLVSTLFGSFDRFQSEDIISDLALKIFAFCAFVSLAVLIFRLIGRLVSWLTEILKDTKNFTSFLEPIKTRIATALLIAAPKMDWAFRIRRWIVLTSLMVFSLIGLTAFVLMAFSGALLVIEDGACGNRGLAVAEICLLGALASTAIHKPTIMNRIGLEVACILAAVVMFDLFWVKSLN